MQKTNPNEPHAILIKPDEMMVELVPFDGTLEQMYKYLHTDIIEVVHLDAVGHLLILDEEGRIAPKNKGYFYFDGVHHCGYGLICKERGEDMVGLDGLTIRHVAPLIQWATEDGRLIG
jgi:hypothetical protein